MKIMELVGVHAARELVETYKHHETPKFTRHQTAPALACVCWECKKRGLACDVGKRRWCRG